MKNFIYALSAILIIFWGIAFYALKVEPVIHILPVIAILSIAFVLFKKKEITEKYDSDVETHIKEQQMLRSTHEVDLA